jgi:hypothetical protein
MTRLALALSILSALGIAATVNAISRTEAAVASAGETIERACIETCPACPPFCARVPGVTTAAYVPPKP